MASFQPAARALERLFLWMARHPTLTIIGCLAFAALRYGLDAAPTLGYSELAKDPFVTTSETKYLRGSILLPLLAHYIGVYRNIWGFLGFCLAIFCCAFLMIVLQVKRRWGGEYAIVTATVVILHPVTVILLSWLGQPDVLTFLPTGVLLLWSAAPILLVASLLGSVNHPEMLLIAPSVVLLRMCAVNEQISFKHFASVAAGVVLGRLAIVAINLASDTTRASSRFEFRTDYGWQSWVDKNLAYPYLTAFSLHNVGWLILLFCAIYGWRYSRRYYIVLGFVQLFGLGLATVSTDTTRVFSLMTWASGVHCSLYTMHLAAKHGLEPYRVVRGGLVVLLLIGLLLPSYYSWEGRISEPSAVMQIWLAFVSGGFHLDTR